MPRAVSDTCCELSVKTCPQEVGDTTVPSIPNLGGTLYATVTPQRLHSPLYPVYYLAEATMAWTIIATSRRVVSLEFLDIDLAEGDTVAVLDGDGPSSPTVAIVTQGSQHSTLISTGTSFYVLFKTSEISTTKRGFLLSYQSGCDLEISATSGTISSPGYSTGQYPSILSCSWLLKVSTPLRLTFKSNFGIENGKDFLRVYKANDVSGTPVHSGSGFTGSVSPGQIDTEDGSLYVDLYTSATGTDVGFTADFTAGCPLIIDSTLEIQPPNYPRYHGDKITVFCKVGYIFSTDELSARNSILLTCSEGKWSMDPLPTCSRVFCGSPPSINNGALVIVTGLYGGDTATYTCNTGYSTTQQQTITCLSNGQWATPPTCSAPTCAPLPTILNGNFVTLKGNGFDHGSVVRYNCIVGYDIIGVDTLTCTQGVWSGQRPLCAKVKCGLPFIEHASLSPSSGVNVNEDVTVSCDSEYRLSGQQTFKCGIDTPPKCINIDECTEGTSGCSQVCTDKDGGFTCSCNEGYRSISVGSAVCEDINECNYSNGGCTNTCENFPGGYRCTCPTGYQLYTYNGLGGILIPIGETGDKPWNLYHINHTCIKQTCPAPALTITNGKVTTKQTSFSFGDQVTYICDIGYILQGQGTLQCFSGNTWSAPAPVCVEATCPQLIIPQGSANTPTVSPQSSISYLSYFTLTCSLSGGGSTTEERPCYYNKQSNTYQVSSTSLTCQRAECGKPPLISGSTSYTTSCTKTGCQFLFECKSPLFTREGTSSSNDFYVRCGSDGQWDFNNLRCSGPTCTDPGTPPGAQQVATSYEEYSLVYYRCDRELAGFLPTNPYPLECVYNYQNGSLQWNATMPTCTDQERPFFYNCPSSERSVRRFNPLPIIDPNPQDNSNLLLRRSVSPANFRGNQTLIASDTQVLYGAEDYAGNIGTCSINVKVIDEEPPILTCRDSFNYQLQDEFDSQTYDVTTFASATDNMGRSSLQFSFTQLSLDKNSIGTIHTITVTARDDANNEDTCIIQVTVTGPVCVPWTVNIENGQKSCLNTGVGSQCTITCNSGYTLFETNDAVSTTIQCSFTTGWPTLPKCVRKTRTPYRYAPSFRYVTATVITTECESSYQNDLSNKIAALLPSLSALCQGQVPSVTVSLPTNYSPVTISSFSGVVTGTFNLEFLPHGYSASQYSQCVNTIKTIFSTSNNIISSVLQLAQVGSCAASSRGTYNGAAAEGIGCYGVEEIRSSVIESGNICVACPPGFVISGSQCSQCGPHSYREMASVNCLPCPPASLNFGSGLISLAECYRVCPTGTVSPSGEAPCNQCPVNTYSINTTYCQPCPTGQVTRGSGHSSNTACKNRCQPGTYSSTGLAPCLSCPKAFYQPSAGATTCLECSSITTTSSVGATSSAQCITAISSVCPSNKCLNGGTCRVVNHDYFCDCPPDFTGSACVTELKACDSSPCYNNGFCINQGALAYTCHCPSSVGSSTSRYSGLRCEIDRNDCAFNPCRNNGSCHDKVGAYTCLCPSFSEYTGSSCSVPRQPCTDNPCPANALCTAAGNLRRKCVCSPGLTGPDCTQDIDECLSNPCLSGGTCRNGNNSFSCVCQRLRWQGVRSQEQPVFPQLLWQPGHLHRRLHLNNLCVAKNPCSSLPCMNGATCQASGSTFSCSCLPGYEGFHCQHETDECASQPCKNGATCVDRYLDYTCICEPGKADTGESNSTYGKNCEDLLNDCTPFPCDTVGTIRCNDLFKDYQCTCRDGYFGKNCSETLIKGDTDCESFPCRHGGTCTDIGTNAYSCSCPNGFTGTNCETRIDYCASNSCINGGTCINSDTTFICICPPGFLGLTCSGVYDICSISRPCLGPGSSCNNNGNTATCQCSTGYDGDNCEQRTSQCIASSCENGGTCNDNLGAARCTCPAGTSGDRCQTNTDDCDSGPCPAGSVCVDGINAYTCQCQPNRIGGDLPESCVIRF
ncbi:sushi, von Willebrand factor type A, EGF and pentraxin domain-containing protein 1-like [Haliotis rubra]|uniref:sushi, von Willebrand factor type A, EGF and pentraxin domain-containing protein 1-like n=1 Tax=Haliotis rubra TaxID=36100 RepID=UPI001EE624D1|nr:sushi, von Willebrand factor type A, EGF and pentraxin domain-containing protein 1-like [Haliotis rubra]